MRTGIHQQIKSANANQNRVLTKNKDIYNKTLGDIKSKIQLVSTVIKTGNTAEFKAKENDIKAVLDQELNSVPDIPSVTILAGDCSNPETLVKVKVNHVQEVQLWKAQGIDTSQDFSKLSANPYRKAKSVNTGVKVHRMRMIEGKLYCAAGDDGIYVYSTTCKLIKEITHIKLRGVRSIAQCGHTVIF